MNCLKQIDKAFVLCLGCNGATSLLLWFAKLDSGSYTAITIATTGAYIGAWATARIKGTPEERAVSPTPPKDAP